MIVSLKDGCFVSGASADSVVLAHDVAQLIEVLKDMDSYSPVEPCRLEHPQVLLPVATVAYLVRSFQSFFFLNLRFM